jgi:plastocyanin
VSKRLVLGAALAALVAFGFVGLASAQSVVTMSMVEFAFEPSTVTVSGNSVTFNARNDGQFPHNIAIDGRDGSLFADNLTTGQSASATITLAPGTYTFYCPVPGHRERGMEGTLIIGAGAQAARAGGLDPAYLSGGLAVLGAALLGGGLLRRRGLI